VSFLGEGDDLVNPPLPLSVSTDETILVNMARSRRRQDMRIVRELLKFGTTLSHIIILFEKSGGMVLNSWTLPF